MAKHIWSVLCYKGAIHHGSNQISLLDVIEQIAIAPRQELPKESGGLPLKMELVSLWMRSHLDVPETQIFRVRLVVPDGAKGHPILEALELDLKNHVRTRSTIQFDCIPYHGPGLYYFVVEQRYTAKRKAPRWRIAARVPLEIRIGQANITAKTSKPTTRNGSGKRESRAVN